MLKGIDIASHQKGLKIANVPADFVIIKATGGTRYVNDQCDIHFQEAAKLNKLIGVYHFAKEVGMTTGNPIDEAEFYLKNIKGYIGKAMLILDFEVDNDVAWAKQFMDHVYNKTGIKPVLYTYLNRLQSANWSSIANADYGLWLAAYSNNVPQGYSTPAPPKQDYWKNVMMYQYTEKGQLSGWNGFLDLNVFYGDKEAWKAYAGIKKEKATYHQEAGFYKMKKDDTFYCDKNLKEVSGWKLAKGSVFCIDKVIKVGNMTRGEIQLGTVKRYITLNTDIVEKA